MKTLVIFDIDGTLTYSESRDSMAFAESYTEVFNKDFNNIDWKQYEHVTDHTIFHSVYQEHFGRSCHNDELKRFQDHYNAKLLSNRKADPQHYKEVAGAKAIVERLLADPHYVVGIGTGGWEQAQLIKLAHIGISVDQIYDSYADDKVSREEILQDSIDLAKAEHLIEKVVYVGDAIWDLQTTTNMNIPFIGVRLKGDMAFFRDKGVRHVLTDLEDADRFLGMVEDLISDR